VFESLRPSLVTFLDERKRELFDLPDAPRPDADTPAPVRLLPEFDNVILGHKDRARIIADAHRPMVTTKNLQERATFLVDGFVAGTWRMETKKGRPSLQLEPFGRLPKAVVKALEEVERTELRSALAATIATCRDSHGGVEAVEAGPASRRHRRAMPAGGRRPPTPT
jgi:hypothetical protein